MDILIQPNPGCNIYPLSEAKIRWIVGNTHRRERRNGRKKGDARCALDVEDLVNFFLSNGFSTYFPERLWNADRRNYKLYHLITTRLTSQTKASGKNAQEEPRLSVGLVMRVTRAWHSFLTGVFEKCGGVIDNW